MEFENLSEEQKAQARECKTVEELMELAEKQGIDLSADQLKALSGGDGDEWYDCKIYGQKCENYKSTPNT